MPPQIPHPDPGVPDTRGPLRYAWWLTRRQPARVLRGSLFGTAWMVGLSIRPYLVARAVDDGLRTGDTDALLFWVAAIVVAGMVLAWLGIMRHRTMTFVREDATARSAALVLRAVSRGGAALTRKLDAGEVATVGGSDIGNTSHMLTMTGPGVGAVIAYCVAAAVLWSVSPMLAVFVLLGVPAIAIGIGPLLRRLDRVESAYRHQQGMLTARATDIVAGLRVLAGVGGRSLFADAYATRSRDLLAEGYRVGAISSWIIAGTVAIPGMFLAAVVWLAARMAAAGEITIGQMVAVYGYVAILTVPVWFLLEGGYQLIRGRVAARRIIALLTIVPDGGGTTATTENASGDNVDGATGHIADGATGRTADGATGDAADGATGDAADGRANDGRANDSRAADGDVGAQLSAAPPVAAPEGPAELYDLATGLRVPVGKLMVVAAADPGEARALADRLGRFAPESATASESGEQPDRALADRHGRLAPESAAAMAARIAPTQASPSWPAQGRQSGSAQASGTGSAQASGIAPAARSGPGSGSGHGPRAASPGTRGPGDVLWGGRVLGDMPLPAVRARILVDEHDSYLFAGTVREILRIRPDIDDAKIMTALHTASAEDVVEALPDGLETPVGARARTLSGGQRQRIRLARALLAEPEVLILIDPTSAVDAHTEARIAARLREARAGRTTVVMATSPLLLGYADVVAHLREGRIASLGRHSELLDTDPAYRALVSRDSDIEEDIEAAA